LNGVRCLTREKEYISRGGKLFTTLSHLDEDINKFPAIGDGEIFNREFTFQEIIRAVKKSNGNTKELQYWIYDIVDTSKPFEERLDIISEFFENNDNMADPLLFKRVGCLVMVPTFEVHNVEEINFYHKQFIEQFLFEGSILRNKDGLYLSGKKSQDVFKSKEFKKDIFKIVGALEGKGNNKGTVIWKLECLNDKSKTFTAKPVGTFEERKSLYNNKNKYIGLKIQIKYFELDNKTGCVSRHPVALKIIK